MARLLGGRPITTEEQKKNDRHSPVAVAAVVGVLLVYIYLFTQVYQVVGLPSPEALAATTGLNLDYVFDDDHNVDCNLIISFTRKYNNDNERLIFFTVVTLAFLCVYFLPLKFKRPALVFWFLTAVILLYGLHAASGLLFAHLVVYLIFHPTNNRVAIVSLLAAGLGILAFSGENYLNPKTFIPWLLLPVAYRYGLLPVLLGKPKVASICRTIAAQSSVLIVFIGASIEGINGYEWEVPLGIFLFFWHWQRVILYHVDYKDGHVPKDLPVTHYLAVFLNPAMIPSWTWGAYIGQGYAYISNNFLCDDKNRLVMAGLKIWGFSLLYLIFDRWFIYNLVDYFEDTFDITLYTHIKSMVRYHVSGEDMSTPTVLFTCLIDQSRWMLLWASVVHFKVGLWRIFGYNVDPHFNRPWLATNLANFWARYAFHFRAFLVSAFYYPVFLRFFKKNLHLRVFVATMAAACVGNMIWGHMSENLFYEGLEWEYIVDYLPRWPYFLLLGLAISLVQVYLLRKKRNRKPWTWGWRIGTDILATYLTIQFYCLIHIFGRPVPNGTVLDYWRLFLIGLGIHLPG